MSLASGNSILNLGIYGNSLVKAPTIIYGSEMRLLMLHNTIYNTDIMKTIELGEIILPNRIKITDPGYFPEEWCCNEANILPGVSSKVDFHQSGIEKGTRERVRSKVTKFGYHYKFLSSF